MRFGALAAHIGPGGDCPLTPIRCRNDGCGLVRERRNAQAHSADCPHRREPCLKCGLSVKPRDMQSHAEKECTSRPVNCKHCRQEVTFSEMQQHLREQCTAVVPMKMFVQMQEQMQAELQCAAEERAELERRLAAVERATRGILYAGQGKGGFPQRGGKGKGGYDDSSYDESEGGPAEDAASADGAAQPEHHHYQMLRMAPRDGFHGCSYGYEYGDAPRGYGKGKGTGNPARGGSKGRGRGGPNHSGGPRSPPQRRPPRDDH
eukprot:TRINITY_DN25588_c0_g1_i2.p1 TRINITY_DN25588_c0_g1~~TRINITY_DN25588_c0_g1_i2.p1  ORF type:complete len:262 (+),score=68.26 TRINITY_DN25588_c0_g1_i2:353-1138(+)